MAGVLPEFQQWEPNGSPTAWVLSVNLKRRHLTTIQKAEIALSAAEQFKSESKQNQTSALKQNRSVTPFVEEREKGGSVERAAKIVGVGKSTVYDYKAIKEASPELAEKVRAGDISIPQAKKQIWDAGAVAKDRFSSPAI